MRLGTDDGDVDGGEDGTVLGGEDIVGILLGAAELVGCALVVGSELG